MNPGTLLPAENPPFLKSIYEGAALPMFVIAVSEDNKLTFEGVNPATEKLTGIKDSGVKGKSPKDLTDLPKEIRKAFRSNYEKCLEAGHSIQYQETIPVNNKLTHWFTTLNPIKNSKGKIVRIVGTSMPVNELVEMQEELQNTKETLELKIDERTRELGERIKETTCLFKINETTKDTTKPQKEILQNIANHIPAGWNYPEQTGAEIVVDKIKVESAGFKNSVTQMKKGIIVNGKIRGYVKVSRNSGGDTERTEYFLPEEEKLLSQISLSIAKYITQKENEEELKEKNDQLEKSLTGKNLLISIISHDLRGPISSIISLLDIVESHYDSIDDTTKKRYLKSILSSAKNTSTLMENLLQWANIEAKRRKISPEVTEVGALIKESLRPLTGVAKEKDIEVTVETPENLKINADKQMVATVIRNLVSNALKFTPRNGMVKTSAKASGHNNVVICVEDTGVGIGEKTLKTILEVGETKSSTGTEGETGSGFGLILCKEFVEKINGELTIESEKEKGTKVYISLPEA